MRPGGFSLIISAFQDVSFSAFAYEASPSESSVGSSIAAVVASP
jgi:hypothetical protein